MDEAILKCVVKCGLLRQVELGKMRYFLTHWRRWRVVSFCGPSAFAVRGGEGLQKCTLVSDS